jgi:hypothetical protein
VRYLQVAPPHKTAPVPLTYTGRLGSPELPEAGPGKRASGKLGPVVAERRIRSAELPPTPFMGEVAGSEVDWGDAWTNGKID